MKTKVKNTNKLFKYSQLIILLTMTTSLILGFIVPLSLFQSLVIMPVSLLLQIGVLGYLEIKFDRNDKTAEIHQLSKRTLLTKCHSKKAA